MPGMHCSVTAIENRWKDRWNKTGIIWIKHKLWKMSQWKKKSVPYVTHIYAFRFHVEKLNVIKCSKDYSANAAWNIYYVWLGQMYIRWCGGIQFLSIITSIWCNVFFLALKPCRILESKIQFKRINRIHVHLFITSFSYTDSITPLFNHFPFTHCEWWCADLRV